MALRAFGDVREGEARGVLLLLLNVFLLLVAYYIIKTVREPLILATGGAEMKSYAAGVQAATLVFFVPLYSWFGSRVPRFKLIVGLTLLFVIGFELFSAAALLEIPYIGFVFYVFVGIFSLSIIAQFWSYANDLYTRGAGERLFGVIAIGATLGAPLGAAIARGLFEVGIEAPHMMHVTSGLLLLSLGVYWYVDRHDGAVQETQREDDESDEDDAADEGSDEDESLNAVNAFKLVFQNRYLMLIAGVMILLNLVNTTGEYILSEYVVRAAEDAMSSDPGVEKEAYIGKFYGEFYFVVNIVTVCLQAFVASRLAKRFGLKGVLFVLPFVALASYSLIAVGVGFAVFRWAKTAENSVDYSIMNTAKAIMWLPTSREEKYAAKQAIDTFFVRGGDMLSAGLVFAGTNWLQLSVRGFAGVNIALIALWIIVSIFAARDYRRLADENPDRVKDMDKALEDA